MSVVRINALTVPADRREELEARFAARAREVSTMPGFEGFELLRPTDDRDVYLVYTRWASEEALPRLGGGTGLPARPQGAFRARSGGQRLGALVVRRDPAGGPGGLTAGAPEAAPGRC